MDGVFLPYHTKQTGTTERFMAGNKQGTPKEQEIQRPSTATASKTGGAERRVFTRHPTDVALICRHTGRQEPSKSRLDDLSFGGLAFVSDERYEPGDTVEVSFPSIAPGQLLSCSVTWRREMKGQASPRYAYGVQFGEKRQLFRARLVKQVRDIEAYREEQLKQRGRRISSDQAAQELTALQTFC